MLYSYTFVASPYIESLLGSEKTGQRVQQQEILDLLLIEVSFCNTSTIVELILSCVGVVSFMQVHDRWVWLPVCPLYYDRPLSMEFCSWEYAVCLLSEVESVRLWEVIYTLSLQYFQSVPRLSSVIERWSAGGRVCYRRFHCTI